MNYIKIEIYIINLYKCCVCCILYVSIGLKGTWSMHILTSYYKCLLVSAMYLQFILIRTEYAYMIIFVVS